MPTFYGPPSDETVIPEQLETALAADLATLDSPIGAASARLPALDSGETFGAKLDAGIGDAVLTIMGDSTGNNEDEWVRLMVGDLAAAHPASRVVYVPWDSAAEAYGAPVEIQAGTSPDVGIVFSDTFARTGDVYGSTPDVGPVWGGYTATVDDWIMDGTDAVRSEDSAGAFIVADGGTGGDQEVRLDATINTLPRPSNKLVYLAGKFLDSQNHIVVQLEVNTDGTTGWRVWEKVAGAINNLAFGSSSTITPNVESAPVTASLRVEGSTLTATVNSEVLTVTLSQASVEKFTPATKAAISASSTPAGAVGDRLHSFEVEALGVAIPGQTITVYNASESGSRLEYHAARLGTVLAVAPDLVIISSSHNYGGSAMTGTYVPVVEDFVEQVRTMHPEAGIAVSSQNPQVSPAVNVGPHAERLMALRVAALRRGWGYIPAFEAFRARSDGGAALIAADGVHPVAAGSALWRDAAMAFLNGLSRRP